MEAAAADPLEYELQREISDILIQNYVYSLRHEFETKLWEHHNCISTLNRKWAEKASEITVLRDELHSVLSVIVASEPGTHHPHQSDGSLEDQMIIVKTKEDSEPPPVTEKISESSEVTLEIPDFSLLKHMHSEEITSFLKTEWLKLRRQHESELHEKTEELFRVKREHAKEKASLPLKKQRELEFIKSKLLQIISKLGEIASRKDTSCFDGNENEEKCRLKDRIGMLLHDNNRLRGLLADKKQEVKHLTLQVSDSKSEITQYPLSSEAKLLDSSEKLRAELEDLKVERHLNSLVDSSVFREVFDNYENQIYDMDQEGSFLRELLDEKEDQLSIIYEDRQKLKYENSQLVSIAESIMEHHDQINLVNDELMMFKGEYNSMKRCLYEAMQEIQACKQEILGLTENLTSMSIALKKAKEQNASLDATIREMKKTPGQSIDSHCGQTGEFDLASMEKLSKTYADFESRLVETMKRNETRLTSLICQFSPLVQQVAVLRKKESWYKQILEIKCSNLRKAEAEVDILADEVDTLLSVLGRIYIALDHYSPVLKHYPGVTEISMLVQKVLKGESIEHLATMGKS